MPRAHRKDMNDTPRPTPPHRPLRRNRGDRMVAGVCSGVADHLGLDPTLVRVGFAVLVIVSCGLALLAYLLGWLFIPDQT